MKSWHPFIDHSLAPHLRTLAVACGAALIVTGHAVAELVYFAKGGQTQLPATIEGDRVRLDTPDGPKTFPRADFAAIVVSEGQESKDPVAAGRDSKHSESR